MLSLFHCCSSSTLASCELCFQQKDTWSRFTLMEGSSKNHFLTTCQPSNRVEYFKSNCQTRKTIVIFLLRSGIESNPGPPKKRRWIERCSCGKFSGSVVCQCQASTCAEAKKVKLSDDDNSHTDFFLDTCDLIQSSSATAYLTTNNRLADKEPLPKNQNYNFGTELTCSNDQFNTVDSVSLQTDVAVSETYISHAPSVNSTVDVPALYRPCQHITVQQFTVQQLRQRCFQFGFQFIRTPCDTSPVCSSPIGQFVPTTHIVPGDGNCLFSALLLAIGANPSQHHHLRTMLCGFISTMNINSQFLDVWIAEGDRVVTRNCSTTSEYLRISRMHTDGTYGTCVEIYSFAQLFHVDVYVFHSVTRVWLCYSCDGDRDDHAVLPIFLYLTPSLNHFETVAGFCANSTTSVTPNSNRHNNVCTNSDYSTTSKSNELASTYSNILKPRSKSSVLDGCTTFPQSAFQFLTNDVDSRITKNKTISNVNMFSSGSAKHTIKVTPVPHSEAHNDRMNGDHCVPTHKTPAPHPLPAHEDISSRKEQHDSSQRSCGKCFRVSTVFYPLTWHFVKVGDIIRRKFGSRLREDAFVCQCCYEYLTKSSTWSVAWPCVLLTILTNKSLDGNDVKVILSYIPAEVRYSWSAVSVFHSAVSFSSVKPVLSDITYRKHLFSSHTSSGLADDLEKALDNEPYPNCRCPFGCFTFVEQTGHISFQHLLNEVLPQFVSFKADHLRYFRGRRKDWVEPFLILDAFIVSGFVFLHPTRGLVVGTCRDHHNGSPLQFVHPPRHPILHRLSVPHPDRLALAVPNLNLLQNVKANYSSHTFQLMKAQGNYSGISSIQLTSKRKWDITSDLLVQSEAQCAYHRQDIRYLLHQLVDSGELQQSIAEAILAKPGCDVVETENSLESSTCVSLLDTRKTLSIFSTLKKDAFLEKFKNITFAHPANHHGANPPRLVSFKNLKLFLIQSLFVISPHLCALISSVDKPDETLLHILGMLDTLIFPKLRNCPYPQFHLPQHLHDLSDSIHNDVGLYVSDCSPHIEFSVVTNRPDVASRFKRSLAGIDIVIFSYNGSNSLRSKHSLPLSVVADNSRFELRNVFSGSPGQNNRALVRHGEPFDKFWLYDQTSGCPKRVTMSPDIAVDHLTNGYWRMAVYYRICEVSATDLKKDFMMSMAGQGRFLCEVHHIPLTRDFQKSGFRCRCGRASFIRCPVATCSASVCKQHTSQSLEVNIVQPTHSTVKDSAQEAKDNASVVHNASNNSTSCCLPDSQFSSSFDDAPSTSSSTNLVTNAMFTVESSAASSISIPTHTRIGVSPNVASEHVHMDVHFKLPLHVLLNGQCGLLKRSHGSPLYVAARFKRMLENVTATSSPMSVPLYQPEAMMFPSIFWKQNADGSYPGSLPSSLFNNPQSNKYMGYATLENHLKTRLMDSSLLTSSDPRYIQFAFDTLFNLQLREHDSRVILNRGWGAAAKDYQQSQKVCDSSISFDQSDSRKHVNELSAALREQPATYFFTYTCSQSTHPGLRKIFAAIDAKYPPATSSKETRLSAIQAEMITMLRAWQRSSALVMKYIETSPEKPLGHVLKLWFRYEFQDQTSAFPHIHALIWTGEDVFSNNVRSRVCCSPSTFLGSLIASVGNNKLSATQTNHLVDLFHKFQTHSCKKAKFRCHKKTAKLSESVCRVPKYPPANDFSYKPIEKNLSPETVVLLQKLGLAHFDPDSCKTVLDPVLCGGKHHYPTDRNSHYSPTNARIFALVQSSTNLQICDTYMSARYLAKYAAGVEERSHVSIRSTSQQNNFTFDIDPMSNQKIAGVQLSSPAFAPKRKRNTFAARVISLTESAWWSLRFPYVVSNISFVHVVTAPKEKRSGVILEKRRVSRHNQAPLYARQNAIRRNLSLPSHRQFTNNQTFLIIDTQKSCLTPDKVTIFGVRPPELRFVRNIEQYFTWFLRFKRTEKQATETCLKAAADDSLWIDGLGYIVVLNSFYFDSFISFCNNYTSTDNSFLLNCVEALACLRSPNRNNFISPKKFATCRQVVFSNVLPRDSSNFVIHILLTLGSYTTELDLFSNSSIINAFHIAGLCQSTSGCDNLEVLQITRRFLLEQLIFYPGSSSLLDRFLCVAHSSLSGATQHNSLFYTCAVPRVLEESVVDQRCKDVDEELQLMKKSIVTAVLNQGIHGLPTSSDLLNATLQTPFPWVPVIIAGQNQNLDSLVHQQSVLDTLCNSMELYRTSATCFIKHQFILGPPGTGKSHVMIHCVVYGITKGFSCIITSLAAERSSILGGRHINALFPFPVSDNASVSHLVSHALSRLARDPVKFFVLKGLDIIFVEEVSMVSAEIWAAMDCVMQQVAGSSIPFGGKLVISTGDFRQLPPPGGMLLLMSNTVLATFEVHLLKEYVRMQNLYGKILLNLLSEYPISLEKCNQIVQIVNTYCNFLPKWSDVSLHVLRVFATRTAEKEAIEQRIDLVRRDPTIQCAVFDCYDEMSNSGTQNWMRANEAVTRFLSNNCPQPRSLFIHVACVLRLTCNLPTFKLFQGQLCVVDAFDESSQTITVRIAPVGFRSLSFTNHDIQRWRSVVLRRQVGVVHRVNSGLVCRRIQLPVKMYVASTVHKIMGDTVPSLATQIVGGKKFALWAKEQLYVVLSRVTDLSNVTFVGNRNETLHAIKELSQKENHLLWYIEALLDIYSHGSGRIAKCQQFHPFPLKHFDVPTASIGFCYLLISVPHRDLFYIGSCKNLRKRLSQHNAGTGGHFTRPIERRPWALAAYVYGFTDLSLKTHAQFEADWQRSMQARHLTSTVVSAVDYLSECHVLMDLYKVNGVEAGLNCDSLISQL